MKPFTVVRVFQMKYFMQCDVFCAKKRQRNEIKRHSDTFCIRRATSPPGRRISYRNRQRIKLRDFRPFCESYVQNLFQFSAQKFFCDLRRIMLSVGDNDKLIFRNKSLAYAALNLFNNKFFSEKIYRIIVY